MNGRLEGSMAEPKHAEDNVQVLKSTLISVFVDEALPDILVVTYERGVQVFKGVLLDSTKRNLPCGVATLSPAFTQPTPKNPNLDDDPLYSANQRYAYTDPSTAAAANSPKKKNVQISAKYKNAKMTVRLRPRQVLCSKCKGICNENSENVSRKRKSSEQSQAAPSNQSTSISKKQESGPTTRASYTSIANKRKARLEQLTPTLVPKLTRLTLQECKDFNVDNSLLSKKPLGSNNTAHNVDSSKKSSSKNVRKRMPRKKRALSTNQDEQWEEPQQNIPSTNMDQVSLNHEVESSTCNTRTIKISYGPQGEGTVLKIPAKLDSLDDDSEENINIAEHDNSSNNTNLNSNANTANKAARRALKKAKKEAKRKVLLTGSPPIYVGNNSPRYAIGASSPRYTVGSASPRHGLGNNSPRYIATYDINLPRRRKHKMKHKKKHRDDKEKDKKHKEGEVSSTQDESCLTQKLSINLKRLNNTYTTADSQPDEELDEHFEENEPHTQQLEENVSSSDEQCEVPDFPPPNPSLTLRINAHSLNSAIGAEGVRLLVGDVIWGKIHGFPWWPGKILTITSCGNQAPQAHISWYGSSTSSLMQCDQLCPYLDNFKIRYNKKKRGPYKEAIKQASLDAQENAQNLVKQPTIANSTNSPTHNIFPQVVQPALASPREIDVVS